MDFRQCGLLSRRRSPESYEFFLHESLPRAQVLDASEQEAASYQGPRVATPLVVSLYFSRINYTLMRGNALSIVKVRMARYDREESRVG